MEEMILWNDAEFVYFRENCFFIFSLDRTEKALTNFHCPKVLNLAKKFLKLDHVDVLHIPWARIEHLRHIYIFDVYIPLLGNSLHSMIEVLKCFKKCDSVDRERLKQYFNHRSNFFISINLLGKIDVLSLKRDESIVEKVSKALKYGRFEDESEIFEGFYFNRFRINNAVMVGHYFLADLAATYQRIGREVNAWANKILLDNF